LPATGAIARTATNVDAGGRTPVAGIVHALAIFLAMVVLAPWAGKLALPTLAGLLVVTAWNMSEPHRWGERLAMPRWELALLLLTAAMTVLVDLTAAIGTGTAIGLLGQWWTRRSSKRGSGTSAGTASVAALQDERDRDGPRY
jgi:SulP family sulfate permease